MAILQHNLVHVSFRTGSYSRKRKELKVCVCVCTPALNNLQLTLDMNTQCEIKQLGDVCVYTALNPPSVS